MRATFLPALELLPNIGLIATLGYGGHQVLEGNLTLGELVAFNVYVVMLIWPLRMLGNIIAQGQRSAAAAERVHEILATAPVIVDSPAGGPLPASGPGRRPGRRPLRGRAVRVRARAAGRARRLRPRRPGRPVGGPRRCHGLGQDHRRPPHPALLRRAVAGAVLVDGVDVRDVRVRELRKAVGIVFEDTFLFSDSIAANIAFADPDAPPEAIARAARLAGADEFIEALPEGYDTPIGERGFSLSGGQRQRIAIARAILADPRVLILDDATSSVDPTKEHEIRDALTEVMRGRTTIVIAHRPATIALADRVVLLSAGHVVADGTHQSLLETSAGLPRGARGRRAQDVRASGVD